MAHQDNSKISLATAIIIGMNAMIGAGVFAAPTALASYVGPAGILTYIFVIIAVGFMAVSIARLAYLFPAEGSFYLYAKQWGGHTVGMIASAGYFFGLLIAMGLLAQIAGGYLQVYFPQCSPDTLGIAMLVALTLLNMFGVALSQAGQYVLIVCTTFPLIAISLLCLAHGNTANLTPFAPFGWTGVFRATQAVIFGFFGFECAASLYAIVKNPLKNVPRALTLSLAFVGMLYLIFAASIILAIPLDLFTNPRLPLSIPLKVVFPHNDWLIKTVHFAILSAIVGTVHSMIWSSSSFLITLIKRLQSNVGKTLAHSPLLTQRMGAFIVGLCILCTNICLRNIGLFFNLTAIGLVTAYSFSIITLLTIPSEQTPGKMAVTLAALGTAAIIFYFAVEGLVTELLKIYT